MLVSLRCSTYATHTHANARTRRNRYANAGEVELAAEVADQLGADGMEISPEAAAAVKAAGEKHGGAMEALADQVSARFREQEP